MGVICMISDDCTAMEITPITSESSRKSSPLECAIDGSKAEMMV